MQGEKKIQPKEHNIYKLFLWEWRQEAKLCSQMESSLCIFWVGLWNQFFFLLKMLPFQPNQTDSCQLLSLWYEWVWHRDLREGQQDGFWGCLSNNNWSVTHKVCVCALTSGKEQSGSLWFLVTLPASFCTWCALGSVLSGDDTISTHWVLLGQAAASLGTSPCGFSSIALNMAEEDWVVLRISRDGWWNFVKHIW